MMELTESYEWHFPFGDERLGRDCLPLIPVLWGNLEWGSTPPSFSRILCSLLHQNSLSAAVILLQAPAQKQNHLTSPSLQLWNPGMV